MLRAELNRNRRIGCEFEMYLPLLGGASNEQVRASLAQVLSRNGLPTTSRGYSSAPIPCGYDLCVESNSSIRGTWEWDHVPYTPIEIDTKVLNGFDDFERIIPKALSICRDMGARVNRTCGFHIHLDFPEMEDNPKHIRSLTNLVYRYENVIYGLVCPSRRTCGYSVPLDAARCEFVRRCRTRRSFQRALAGWDRHRGLNLTDVFSSSPQVEMRYHGGTLNEDKVRHWVIACLQLFEHSLRRNCQAGPQLPNSRQSLGKLLICIGCKPNRGVYTSVSPEIRDTGRWLLARWKNLNGAVSLRPKKTPAATDPSSRSQ